MSLAKQLIESGKASDELMDAYLNLQMGEFDCVIGRHKEGKKERIAAKKRDQGAIRQKRFRANKKMEMVK